MTDRTPETPAERPGPLADPRMAERARYALYGLCALLLLVDPFLHKYGYFAIETLWGFYGLYAFIACVACVLIAKGLRRIVLRPEDYYDR